MSASDRTPVGDPSADPIRDSDPRLPQTYVRTDGDELVAERGQLADRTARETAERLSLTVEVVALTRSWPCRLLRHRACRIAYESSRAVAYPDPAPRFPVVGWLRCPCPCHGELPIHPRAEESA